MPTLIKSEFFKIKRKGIVDYLIILSVLPLLFAIYGYKGQLVLPDSGYSCMQWLSAIFYELSQKFLLSFMIYSIINDYVFSEYIDGYVDLLKLRRSSKELIAAKFAAMLILSFCFILLTASVIVISYFVMALNSDLLSGNFVNASLASERFALELNLLILYKYAVFMPAFLLIFLELKTKPRAYYLPLIVLELFDRILMNIDLTAPLTFSYYIDKAVDIMRIDENFSFYLPYFSSIFILLLLVLIAFIKRKSYKSKKRKAERSCM